MLADVAARGVSHMICEPRRKCDEFLPLDIRQLKAHGRLAASDPFTWEWTRNGEPLASVRISVDAHGLALSYLADRRGVTQRLDFARTACHLGGARYWMRCPSCTRRCAVMYGVNEAGLFACRLCMRL